MGVALSDLLHPFLFSVASAVPASAGLAFLQYIAQQYVDKQCYYSRYGQGYRQVAPPNVHKQENGNGS